MAVEEFGKSLLAAVGAPAGKRAKVHCFTQVAFEKCSSKAKSRPDGLVVVEQGSKRWSCLVEAKIGQAELDTRQVEAYLDLARENGVDAVVTISNQFVARPDQPPIKVNGHKIRSVKLWHWSWMSLISEAVLHADNKLVSDPDQAYILGELIRFFDHPKSGAAEFDRMGRGWRETCQAIRNQSKIKSTDAFVTDATSSWLELVRHLSLRLSTDLGQSVSIYLPKAQKKGQDARIEDSVKALVGENYLSDEFSIPDAASRMRIAADFKSKVVSASMIVDAPKDKSRATACVNWIKRQLDSCEDGQLLIKATYPGGVKNLAATLAQLRDDPKCLTHADSSLLPSKFEVCKLADCGVRFAGPKTFVEEAERLTMGFYRQAGQYLRAWQPSPPKPKPVESATVDIQGEGEGVDEKRDVQSDSEAPAARRSIFELLNLPPLER